MNSVRYDESLYRTGYRPYGLTNARGAAAGLSGFSSPQGGDRLRGLRGLGGTVTDGSVVTYQGSWPGYSGPTGSAGEAALPTDILNSVIAILNGEGLTVINSSSNAGLVQTVEMQPFAVQLTIQVATGQGGFGAPQDIISIINNAVYQATGQMPSGGSIPVVQAPGASPAGTGMPNIAPPGMTPTPPGSPSSLSSWLPLLAIAAVAIVLVER